MSPNQPERRGSIWSASFQILTAVIGCEFLSNSYAVSQLGFIPGLSFLVFFALLVCWSSVLLVNSCPNTGTRHRTYGECVRATLGEFHAKVCGGLQYAAFVGSGIGFTVGFSSNLMAVERSSCLISDGHDNLSKCHVSSIPYLISFGVIQIILSQISDSHQVRRWLPCIATVTSLMRATIGIGLTIAMLADKTGNGRIMGSLSGHAFQQEHLWSTFNAIGTIASTYTQLFAIIIETQDTLRSPPDEGKTMKKAILVSVAVTTTYNMVGGILGYAAFGDNMPDNLVFHFCSYSPFWLVDMANIMNAVYMLCAYQIFCQPILDKSIYHDSCLFRFILHGIIIAVRTVISMYSPFITNLLAVLGAIGFGLLTVVYPVAMYMKQNRVPTWRKEWVLLRVMILVSIMLWLVAMVGSCAKMVSYFVADYVRFQTINDVDLCSKFPPFYSKP